MAEDSVDLKAGSVGLRLAGPNALILFIFIAILLNTVFVVIENHERQKEHAQIECYLKLGIFVHTWPKGSAIAWENMPVDLYGCIPKFLYERPIR